MTRRRRGARPADGDVRRSVLLAVVAAALVAGALPAHAQSSPPLLHPLLPRGEGRVETAPAPPPATAPVRIDGDLRDWRGTPSRFGGTTLHDGGELVYQDHIWDAYGAAGAAGAGVGAIGDGARDVDDGAGRGEGIVVGLGTTSYGAGPYERHADLLDLRMKLDGTKLRLAARTVAMVPEHDTALLVILDTRPDDAGGDVPFLSGLTTGRGDVAALVTAGGPSLLVDLATGEEHPVTSASDADGWRNTLEAELDLAVVGYRAGDALAVAAGTGIAGGDGLSLVGAGEAGAIRNVAFRSGEPPAPAWDRDQALALRDGTIDAFFVDLDPTAAATDRSERFRAGHGYHARIFRSTADISDEGLDLDGIDQQYGVWLPAEIERGTPRPLTFWLHGSGQQVHAAAVEMPNYYRQVGDGRGAIVVDIQGRGENGMYVGESYVDHEQVWADVHATFPVDEARRSITGYSMGGYGAFLYSSLHPDRYNAAFSVAGVVSLSRTPPSAPVSGPCEEMPGSACHVGPITDDDPAHTDLRSLFPNVRHVPVGHFQGMVDELAPVAHGLAFREALTALGYRHRLYLFPHFDHYGAGVTDEWGEIMRYLDAAPPREAPARVTYVRDLDVEAFVERGTVPTGDDGGSHTDALSVDFDGAYWIDELQPADGLRRAFVEATSLALVQHPAEPVAERGGPAAPDSASPYVMTGLAWDVSDVAPQRNAVVAEVTGAARVAVDVLAAGLDLSDVATVELTTDAPVEVILAGVPTGATVTIDGRPAETSARPHGVAVRATVGTAVIEVSPPAAQAPAGGPATATLPATGGSAVLTASGLLLALLSFAVRRRLRTSSVTPGVVERPIRVPMSVR